MSRVMVPRKTDWGRLLVAMAVGCAMIHFGGVLLDVRLEYYYGLDTFNWFWGFQLYLVPFITGVVIGLIYGYGAKWIAHFPPLIVLTLCILETMYLRGLPEDTLMTPLGWWGFFVILAMEFCAFGGVIGELYNKRFGYHRY